MLSFVRAFASVFSVRLTSLALELRTEFLRARSRCPGASTTPRGSSSRRSSAIAVRYWPTVSSTIRSWSLAAKAVVARGDQHARGQPLDVPLPRPGSVSSKSLTSNTSRRSGEANTPKFDRCASPQHCTVSPDRGVDAEIVRHDHRGPAIERKRRHEHPAVADRHELGHARLRLTLEQLDRIGPLARRLKERVARARDLSARGLAARDPLIHRQVRHRPGRRLPRLPSPRDAWF